MSVVISDGEGPSHQHLCLHRAGHHRGCGRWWSVGNTASLSLLKLWDSALSIPCCWAGWAPLPSRSTCFYRGFRHRYQQSKFHLLSVVEVCMVCYGSTPGGSLTTGYRSLERTCSFFPMWCFEEWTIMVIVAVYCQTLFSLFSALNPCGNPIS